MNQSENQHKTTLKPNLKANQQCNRTKGIVQKGIAGKSKIDRRGDKTTLKTEPEETKLEEKNLDKMGSCNRGFESRLDYAQVTVNWEVA